MIADGPGLASAILLWVAGGYLLAGTSWWLALKRKKVAALVSLVPAAYVAVVLFRADPSIIARLPLFVCVASLVPVFVMRKKEPNSEG
jgi:hypothetical protein